MMQVARILILGTTMFIGACESTGVVPMDRGSFMISKVSPACGFRSAAGTRAELYTEANQFCSSRRQEVSTVTSTSQDGIIGARCASAELVFRCVDPGAVDMQADERIRQDVRQNRRDNQVELLVTPRPVFQMPRTPSTTDCNSFGNSVSCTTR
jgi:hypothetical protein